MATRFHSKRPYRVIKAVYSCESDRPSLQSTCFLEDTATPILQTDASNYGIIGPQLNWSVREKECFEDLLDNRPFILNTDHMNLTYISVTLTGKVMRWKLYLQDKDFHLCHVPGKEVYQGVPDALSRLCKSHMPVKQDAETRKKTTSTLSALQPKQHHSDEVYDRIAAVHNSSMGHWGQAKCRAKLNDASVTDRMINTSIR